MKNARGNAKTTYSRMAKREGNALDDWLGASKPPGGRGMPAKKSAKAKYNAYTKAAKKRAQAGKALKK